MPNQPYVPGLCDAMKKKVTRREQVRRKWMQHMLVAVPYQVHTILTDNGIQFAEQPKNRSTIISWPMRFDMMCEANGIEHRLTKPNHPWTNGQFERINRTLKDATVKRLHYDSHDQLRARLADFMAAYNFARRLKTLGGVTPYEYICKIWTSDPDGFILYPIHQMPGLNTYGQNTSVNLAELRALWAEILAMLILVFTLAIAPSNSKSRLKASTT